MEGRWVMGDNRRAAAFRAALTATIVDAVRERSASQGRMKAHVEAGSAIAEALVQLGYARPELKLDVTRL